MSYKIGQFRKNQIGQNQYMTSIDFTVNTAKTYLNGVLDQTSYFKDIGISPVSGTFENSKNYFVRLAIVKTQQIQNFQIILNNKDDEQNLEQQFLKSFFVPSKNNNITDVETVMVQIVFNPIVDFNQLVLKLSRTASDYAKMNKDGNETFAGRIITIDEDKCKCFQIMNILNIDSLRGINEFAKIGVQGPTGLLMCINGEEIRVGPSGLYEIKNGYKVNFMGFVVTEEFADEQFLLDYQY